ncbi:MAG: type VII toxin-antitoxin system HepT family RNase toxin [Candidatus Asgardarchaeia archaeon]
MDEKRVKRYKEKLDLIETRISQIREWTDGFNEEDFDKNELVKLATYKAFQEIVEGSMDLIAMLCKDNGVPPKDDYSNVEALLKKKIMDDELSRIMIEGNGLRNRIVHKYDKLDDKKAFVEIVDSLTEFERFIEVVENWIEKRLKR